MEYLFVLSLEEVLIFQGLAYWYGTIIYVLVSFLFIDLLLFNFYIVYQIVGDLKGAAFGGLLECPLNPTPKRKYQVDDLFSSFVYLI